MTETDGRRVFRELRSVHLEGADGADAGRAPEQRPTPALIAPIKDLTRVRYDYPLCVAEGAGVSFVRTLTSIVDEVIAVATDSSDEGQRLKRHIYQLEASVKKLADQEPGATLSSLWHRAADEMVAATRLVDDDRQMLKQDMNVARGALRAEGELVTCDPRAARRLFRAAISADWSRRAASVRDEIDRLMQGLREILAASFMRTSEARSPEHLEAAVGEEESMDYQAMSSILQQSHVGEPIPQARVVRIQDTLSVLERFRPLFNGETVHPAHGGEPLGIEVVETACSTVRERYDREKRMLADFFKAVRIARLEVENRYHDGTHEAFFARFGPANLSDEELRSCPPIPVVLESAASAGSESVDLFDLLTSGIPVKALLGVEDLVDARSLDAAIRLRWPARFASAACALNDVYVVQAPLSDAALLQLGMQEGLAYAGPSVFVVYYGDGADQPGMSTYHCAAAATESRLFPAFIYDPGKGPRLAGRMDVTHNPRPQEKWSREPFTFVTADDEEKTVDLAFTPADFLLCDIRAGRHFWSAPREKWHPDMLPLHEYLDLDENTAETKLPYLTAVSPGGEIVRVVPTRSVVDFVRACGAFWRIMQEYGGIESSFAIAALADEKQRLQREKERDVEAIKKEYETEINRNLGDVTREIIRRIVEGVVSGTANVPAAPGAGAPRGESASPSRVPAGRDADAPSPRAAGGAEAEVEEDEIVSLDEPYIDTPLCTSCNECINLNKSMFAYNENKQAYIKDASAGTFRELVVAAEKCPVHIIHPGKPKNPDEPGVDDLVKRAAPFN